MFSKMMVMVGSLFLTAVLASFGASAHADNINTSGVACRNYNASEALDIDYLFNGARNLNASPRSVICPISRSPLTGTPSPTFWVFGSNNPGTATSCTVYVHDYLGTLISLQSFTQSVPASGTTLNWFQAVTFPTLPAAFDFATMLCTIPASAGGVIHGVTAVQP